MRTQGVGNNILLWGGLGTLLVDWFASNSDLMSLPSGRIGVGIAAGIGVISTGIGFVRKLFLSEEYRYRRRDYSVHCALENPGQR